MEMAGDYCSLLKMKDIFSNYHNPKCDKTSYWKCIHDTCVPCRALITTSVPSDLERRKKNNGWSLPLVLFNYCFLVQDVQEVFPLLSLKTLESVYMHCGLGTFLSCHFSSRHAYCVTNVSGHRTQILPFTLATFMNNVLFFPMPTLLLKEVCKGKMAFIVMKFPSM